MKDSIEQRLDGLEEDVEKALRDSQTALSKFPKNALSSVPEGHVHQQVGNPPIIPGTGHTIREDGTDLTARTGLNFVDTDVAAAVDDSAGDETEVRLNLYAALAGRSGGQTLIGGTASGNSLTLQANSPITGSKKIILNESDLQLASGTTYGILDSGGTRRIHATSGSTLVLTGDTHVTNGYFSADEIIKFAGNAAVTWAGSQDNYALGADSAIYVTLTGNATLTGMSGGSEGRTVFILNVDDVDTLTIADLTTSSATNQFQLNGNMSLGPNEGAVFRYHVGDTKWRCVGRYAATAAGGGTLDDAYDFGGAGAGAQITVDSGAVHLINGGGSPTITPLATALLALEDDTEAILHMIGDTGASIYFGGDTGGSQGAGIRYQDSDRSLLFDTNTATEIMKLGPTELLIEQGLVLTSVTSQMIAADTNDWNPSSGIGDHSVVLVNVTGASRNLTGLVTDANYPNGRIFYLHLALGSQNLVLKHEVTSTAAYRFNLPGDADYTLHAGDAAMLWYDDISNRWMLLGVAAQPVAGSGDVATDTIWDAAGDLAIGTGADTAAVLTVGAANTVLQPSGGTIAWVTDPTFNGVTVSQAFTLSGKTDVTWAAQTNDYALGDVSVLNVTLTGAQSLTGMTGGAEGRIVMIQNVDTADILTIQDSDAGSAAANQFLLYADIALSPYEAAIFRYDGVNSKWLCAGRYLAKHGNLAALTDDDHTQYAALAGRAGGQTLYGGTTDNQDLILGGTASATHTTSIISALDHVRLASGKVIQDSGGGTRITLGTASPEVTLTGDVQITGKTGIGNTAPSLTRWLYLSDTASSPTSSFVGGEFSIAVTAGGTSAAVYGLFGGASLNGIAGSTLGSTTYGLDFTATGSSPTSPAGNTTFTAITGIRVLTGSRTLVGGANINLVTTATGAQFGIRTQRTVSGTANITNGVGLHILQPAHVSSGTNQVITNYTGARIEDYTTYGTAPTINYLLEVGGGTGPTGTVTTTSGLFRIVGNFTAAANVTPLWVSEGATPTVRQLKTFDPGAAGANFTAGQLVCVLV